MAEPCVFIIFGGTGDLAKKKLIPALYRLHAKGALEKDMRIITVGRKTYTTAEILKEYAGFIDKGVLKKNQWYTFGKRISYHRLEFSEDSAYNSLRDMVFKLPANVKNHRMFYLATPPGAVSSIVEQLARTHLAERDPEDGWHRVVVEKPFGSDRKSARSLNNELGRLFSENQIYRIDHYIGKTFVQEILSIRFANPIFENQWSSQYIESVKIGISESVGIESRGGYYDKSGAIRDMLQNHLMQLLALTTMEPPKSASADDIRSEKVKVIKRVVRPGRHKLKRDLVIGQYTEGAVGKKKIPSYTAEKDVMRDSETETYVAWRAAIDNDRWSGVPFFLWTGKALKEHYAEINIRFKKGNWLQIPDSSGVVHENIFTIRIQPEEGLRMSINLSNDANPSTAEPSILDFTRPVQYGINSTEAYEFLLLEAIDGDQTLFTRTDFVDASWKIVDNLLAHKPPIEKYRAGTRGPLSGLRLLDHRHHLMGEK